VTSAGDPVQDWDRTNHLYYGGIAFNRDRPSNASIWVAPLQLEPAVIFLNWTDGWGLILG
jgi:hypothetical protein